MSLIAWWPLNGTIENKGLDRDYDTPATNYSVFVDGGKIGQKCLNPTTTTSGVLKYSKTLSNAHSYTMCAWVKSNDSETSSKYIFWTGSDNSGGFGFSNSKNGTTVNAKVFGASNISLAIGLGEWHHVALVVDYENLEFSGYLDGNFVQSRSYTQGTVSNAGVNIGWLKASYYPFKGFINDARIYDTVLSPKEIKEIAKGLVLHYPFNDVPYDSIIPCELTGDNYTMSNYSSRTSSTLSGGVYHVNGYQSSSGIDTAFALTGKTLMTLAADTDYYLSFYCRCKADASQYFGTRAAAYTGLKDSSNNYYRPSTQFTLGTSYDGFVSMKIHTGSSTQYRIAIGYDTPNLYGVGSYIEFSNVMLTRVEPNRLNLPTINLLPLDKQRMTDNGQTSTNEYMNICSTFNAIETYGLVPFTISFEIKAAVEHSFSVYGGYASNPKYNFDSIGVNVTTEWSRVVYTFIPRMGTSTGTWSGISVYGTYGSGAIVSVRNVKLELATLNMVYDGSGYGNDGLVMGKPAMIESLTPRFGNSIKLTCPGYSKSNSIYNYVRGNITLYAPSVITFAFWFKGGTRYSGGTISTSSTTAFSDYTTTVLNDYDSYVKSKIGDSTYNLSSSKFTRDGTWHHYAIVYDASNLIMYKDGESLQTVAATGTMPTFNYVALNYSAAGGGKRGIDGAEYSDFRIYTTALSATDVKELYNTSMTIDNLGSIYSFEFIEENIDRQKVLETGITKVNELLEVSDRLKVLSDGSVWLQILHHNNPASNLFTVNNCWLNSDANLYSNCIILKNSPWVTSMTEFEFLVCEMATSGGTEHQCRWKQTSNPALSSTLSGYSVISGTNSRSWGLMNKGTTGCFHNGASWWCCCGSYSVYNGGIPGFEAVVTSGYLDLYIRIPDAMAKGDLPESAVRFYNKSILGSQMIER